MMKKLKISKYTPSIFQSKMDFESVAKRQMPILAIEYPIERVALTVLVSFLAILFCAYFYLVVASVLNIIARKEADARSARLQSDIGTLEHQYFELSQSITPQSASEMGLAPIQATAYVYRPGNAASADTANSGAI